MTEQEQRFLTTYNALTPAQKELVQQYIDDLTGDSIKPFYTTGTAAGILQTSVRTVERYIKDKKLKAHKVGGRQLIYAEDLREFLDGR